MDAMDAMDTADTTGRLAGRLCDRHRPRTSLDVLLSQTELASMRQWIRGGAGGLARATAPPGSGLTTAVTLLARELGMETTWLTAGNARAKTLLSDAISSRIAVTGRPKLVVLDDFDALLTDTQLAGELATLTRTGGRMPPVLCLGHVTRASKIDDVTKKWENFRFQRPPLRAVVERVTAVAAAEGIECAPGAIAELCGAARGDLRAALNALDMVRSEDSLKCGETTLDDVLDGLDAVKLLLREPVELRDALRLASGDPSVVPMGIFENYAGAARDVHTCSKVADLFSLADTVDKRMYATQAWELTDVYMSLAAAGPAVVLERCASLPDTEKLDPQKFGLVWSKMYNQCAKAKSLRALCHSRAEAGLHPLNACDLAYPRFMLHTAVQRGDSAAVADACHGMQAPDVLALMRLWKTEYKTSTHARVKKVLLGTGAPR